MFCSSPSQPAAQPLVACVGCLVQKPPATDTNRGTH